MDKDLSINQVNQIKLNIVNVKRRAWLYAIYITYNYDYLYIRNDACIHYYYYIYKEKLIFKVKRDTKKMCI